MRAPSTATRNVSARLPRLSPRETVSAVTSSPKWSPKNARKRGTSAVASVSFTARTSTGAALSSPLLPRRLRRSQDLVFAPPPPGPRFPDPAPHPGADRIGPLFRARDEPQGSAHDQMVRRLPDDAVDDRASRPDRRGGRGVGGRGPRDGGGQMPPSP